MPKSRRQLLLRLALFLGAGTAIGWIYGRPEIGLLIAALAALSFQVRQLLAFDRHLRPGEKAITGAFGRQAQPEAGLWAGDFGPDIGRVCVHVQR